MAFVLLSCIGRIGSVQAALRPASCGFVVCVLVEVEDREGAEHAPHDDEEKNPDDPVAAARVVGACAASGGGAIKDTGA